MSPIPIVGLANLHIISPNQKIPVRAADYVIIILTVIFLSSAMPLSDYLQEGKC